MKTPITLLFVVASIVSFSLHAQEHAPSSDMCWKDAALWTIQAASPDSLNYQELSNRVREMTDCNHLYGKNDCAYSGTALLYEQLIEGRFVKFLFKRHPEMGKRFVAEDAARLR